MKKELENPLETHSSRNDEYEIRENFRKIWSLSNAYAKSRWIALQLNEIIHACDWSPSIQKLISFHFFFEFVMYFGKRRDWKLQCHLRSYSICERASWKVSTMAVFVCVLTRHRWKYQRKEETVFAYLISCKRLWVKRGLSCRERDSNWTRKRHRIVIIFSEVSFDIEKRCIAIKLMATATAPQTVSQFIRKTLQMKWE